MIKNSILNYAWILLLSFWSCSPTPSNTLRIAAASNMQFALADLTHTFDLQSGAKTELIISSSGKLTAQIIEGAPFDIFLSADMKYPQAIYEKGKCIEPPEIYARGQLVLWSANKKDGLSLESLLDDDIKHIAMANPINAPYGFAAKECLAYHNIETKITDKLVFGESISQVNQFISTGAAEIGFTSKSVVMAPNMNSTGSWIDLPISSYSPVNQGIVIIDNKKNNNTLAQEFYKFLFTDEAQQILKDFGYLGIKA